MKRPLIGGKDFQTSIGQGEQVQGRFMGSLQKEGMISCVFFSGKKEENDCVRRKLVFMCERMLFMKKMCANKEHGKKLCVANSCNGIHGRSFMNKPLDSYLK